MKKHLRALIFAFVLMLGLAGCESNTIVVPNAAAEYIGKNYESVIAELQDAGFSSIETVVVEDLTSTKALGDFAVGEISIDSNSTFIAGAKFSKNAKVIVTYYTIPSMIVVPNAATEYIGKNYESVIAELQDAGFSNIETVVVEDLTSTSVLDDYAAGEVSIDSNSTFIAGAEFSKNANVVITYHTIPKLQIPISATDLQGFDYETLAIMFAEAGFANISSNVVYDLDPDVTSVEFENEVSVNHNRKFSANEEVVFDSGIEIICHRPFEKFAVSVHIDFVSNWFFNLYDVAVFIDGHKEEVLAHGENYTFKFDLKEGLHTIKFEKAEDPSIDGKISLDVNTETEASYTISCWNDYISVEENYVDRVEALGENEVKIKCEAGEFVSKNYQEVIKTLKEWGFVNIIEKPLYDIHWGITTEGSASTVTIDGRDDYRRGDVFDKNVEIIVPYHLSENDDPSRIKMTKNATEYEGKPYDDVVNTFKTLGFSNVVLAEIKTDDPSLDTGKVYRITIDYDHFSAGEAYRPEDKVLIEYYKCEDPPSYEVVKVQTLLNELEANALRAERTYQDKFIEVTGKLDTIDSDGDYITICAPGDKWGFDSLHCSIEDDSQLDSVLEKNIGDSVTIKGQITSIGEALGYYIDIHEIR